MDESTDGLFNEEDFRPFSPIRERFANPIVVREQRSGTPFDEYEFERQNNDMIKNWTSEDQMDYIPEWTDSMETEMEVVENAITTEDGRVYIPRDQSDDQHFGSNQMDMELVETDQFVQLKSNEHLLLEEEMHRYDNIEDEYVIEEVIEEVIDCEKKQMHSREKPVDGMMYWFSDGSTEFIPNSELPRSKKAELRLPSKSTVPNVLTTFRSDENIKESRDCGKKKMHSQKEHVNQTINWYGPLPKSKKAELRSQSEPNFRKVVFRTEKNSEKKKKPRILNRQLKMTPSIRRMIERGEALDRKRQEERNDECNISMNRLFEIMNTEERGKPVQVFSPPLRETRFETLHETHRAPIVKYFGSHEKTGSPHADGSVSVPALNTRDQPIRRSTAKRVGILRKSVMRDQNMVNVTIVDQRNTTVREASSSSARAPNVQAANSASADDDCQIIEVVRQMLVPSPCLEINKTTKKK